VRSASASSSRPRATARGHAPLARDSETRARPIVPLASARNLRPSLVRRPARVRSSVRGRLALPSLLIGLGTRPSALLKSDIEWILPRF
jgi:hypothetical protein